MSTIRATNPARRVLHAAGFLMLACCIAALGACNVGEQPTTAGNAVTQSIPVEVVSATQQSITANYSGTATLEAVADAQVVAKATGIVLQLLVEEGMRVRKGQLLAVLDDAAARNKLAQANGTLRKAQAAFEKAQKGLALQVTSRSEFDSDKYDLETQRAVVVGASIDLANTRVLAPIAGVIAKRSIKLGNLVQANQALFEIVDMDPLQAVLNVPERDLDTLKAGQSVRLRVDALPGKDFGGTIARIAPVVDAASGTFRATCEFRDDTHALKPGMFGRVDVAYDQRHDALVVPRAAIVEEDGESSVFVIEPVPVKKSAPAAPAKGKSGEAVAAERVKPIPPGFVARRRLVKTGYGEGDRVEIRDGLHDGDRVITVGRNAVRDGTEVQVIGNPLAVAVASPETKR